MAADERNDPTRADVPDAFVQQVRDLLQHLWDFPYLEKHPLTEHVEENADAGATAGQRLRRHCMAAIEMLSPGVSVDFRAPHARLYSLAHQHYVEGLTVQEAAHELGISARQAYRDLRRVEENIAAVLWARGITPSQKPRAALLSSIATEIDRLESHPQSMDVRPLVQQAQAAVERLAQQRGLDFQVRLPPEPIILTLDQTAAKQVLTNLLSLVVRQAMRGDLCLELGAGRESDWLRLDYRPEAASSPLEVNTVAAQLAGRLGWQIEQKSTIEGRRTIMLRMTQPGPKVLVIDDNEGLTELLQRFLIHHACQVMATTSSSEGLRLARTVTPDAIVLDVMMPEMDGWEVLQSLRSHPQTAAIPVIICSVFDDPELAYSLGASRFLPKPVSRDSVLKALHDLNVL